MRIPASARALGWRTGKRAVDWSASQLKLASYVPMYDYREQLDAKTTLTRDDADDPRQARLDRLRRRRRPDADASTGWPTSPPAATGRGRQDARGRPEVRDPHAVDRRASRAVVRRLLRLRGGPAPARALGGGAHGASRVGVRRPAPGGGAARARPVRPRLLPRRSLPQRVPPRAARDAQPCDAPRRRDAARDDDRSAARLGGSRPLAARDGQGEDGADLRCAADRARLDGLARRHGVHGLPAGVRRGAAALPEDRRARATAPTSRTSSGPSAALPRREPAARGVRSRSQESSSRRSRSGARSASSSTCRPSSATS